MLAPSQNSSKLPSPAANSQDHCHNYHYRRHHKDNDNHGSNDNGRVITWCDGRIEKGRKRRCIYQLDEIPQTSFEYEVIQPMEVGLYVINTAVDMSQNE